MLRFEWNALRVGDLVLVHDPAGRLPAASGTVVTVDTNESGAGPTVSGYASERRVGTRSCGRRSWRFTTIRPI